MLCAKPLTGWRHDARAFSPGGLARCEKDRDQQQRAHSSNIVISRIFLPISWGSLQYRLQMQKKSGHFSELRLPKIDAFPREQKQFCGPVPPPRKLLDHVRDVLRVNHYSSPH
jgi:hypothetical protein